ncbi:expressed protein [Chlorella variabilis]|uniref:Expressed protein n=1 Tax=Chlorella variabilis TaxID=554065 RepID=E1ZPY9_CHLVA|nr:expressed protein [Chlorella variabilis]EFN52063.1 expressed protein [Chlorella variabilis]|eukprot:XP_005844165.1 expressed protein [Chlorella variabilis]
MVTQQAAAAAATHLGWEERDGTLYILESSDEGEEQDDAVQQEEADVTPPAISGGRLPEGAEDAQLMPEEDGLLPERPSWRIAGHQWVLNTVIPYRVAYQRVTKAYSKCMEESPKDYPAVVVAVAAGLDLNVSRKIETYIRKNMGTKGALRSPDQLPQMLPVANCGERFAIPADDLRCALAADPGALGWRNRATGQHSGKRGRVPKDTVLGAYQSLQLLQPEYMDMIADPELAADMQLTGSQLSLCCEAFAADSSVGDGFFTKKTRLAEPLLAEFDVSSCRHDVSLDPLIELKRGVRQLSHLQGGANCLFVEALVFGWPHLFVITTRDVEPGEEFLLDYGRSYWQNIAKEKQRCRMSEAEQQQLRAMYEAEQARLMEAGQKPASLITSGQQGTAASGVAASGGDGGDLRGTSHAIRAPAEVLAPMAEQEQAQQEQAQQEQEQAPQEQEQP